MLRIYLVEINNKFNPTVVKHFDVDPDLAALCYNATLRGMIHDGFDPKGLSEEQVRHEVVKEARIRLRMNDDAVVSVIDETGDITREARRFEDRGLYKLALLLHATAIEHWINDIIVILCRRKGLSRDEAIQIIRETPFRAKCAWLLKLLDASPIRDAHLKKLDRLMQLRNEFVHFKWKGTNLEQDEQEEAKKFLEVWKPTQKYISRYRKRILFRDLRFAKYSSRRVKALSSSPRSAS
jgi:hypothetical protein